MQISLGTFKIGGSIGSSKTYRIGKYLVNGNIKLNQKQPDSKLDECNGNFILQLFVDEHMATCTTSSVDVHLTSYTIHQLIVLAPNKLNQKKIKNEH
ncbi:hypothetical protein BLOT_010845 [Blomia tropicalis]|nr:hypothetical protein BLOT_010845 [Blomia tropicalis]